MKVQISRFKAARYGKGIVMYLRILKKELRRKRTMNIILLVFIVLAATFIASSTNNMVTVSNALDDYFIKAEVPDYWLATAFETEADRFCRWSEDNGYTYSRQSLIQADPTKVTVNGIPLDYNNSLCLSRIEKSKIFDSTSRQIREVRDGEIYVTATMSESEKNDFSPGSTVIISTGSVSREFKVKDYTKDALFGSTMVGMTRFLISDNDYQALVADSPGIIEFIGVLTDHDPSFSEKYGKLDLNTIFNMDCSQIKLMYLMDILTAAIMLVVSLCLILISMVILHFSIRFTVNEDFREIGVMKAIGIPDRCIRGLYMIKYLAIAAVGTASGLILSFPYSRLMLGKVAKKIILSSDSRYLLNIISALGTALMVGLFCCLCTRKIRSFSPIDAIRSGETGERYTHKGLLHLSQTRLSVIPFLAVNDILSGIRRFFSMILIFTIGILLVILPVDAINTLRSDELLTWFNMAECSHVMTEELLFTTNGISLDRLDEKLDTVKNHLQEKKIPAKVFQEVSFRMNISHGDKSMSSLAFQGIGDVTTDDYTYIRGEAPSTTNEVAVSHTVADKIGAAVGDEVQISTGDRTRTYIISAINESLNNLGESIRFHPEEQLDYSYAVGCFGTQIRYLDDPGHETMTERKNLLKQWNPESDICTSGEYVSQLIGNSADEMESIKTLILAIVLCINLLVTVLMVKSFIIKEKYEIALLKATGFLSSSLIRWQAMRIGLVLSAAAILGSLLSAPLASLIINPIFRQMGAQSIDLAIHPAEVYLLYPLIILTVTVSAAVFSAQCLRKIETSEISNNE